MPPARFIVVLILSLLASDRLAAEPQQSPLTQRAAETLSAPALAKRIFSEGGSNADPEGVFYYWITGNSEWPPFRFSHIVLATSPRSAGYPGLCTTDVFDVDLDPARETGDESLGLDAPVKVRSIKVGQRYLFINAPEGPWARPETSVLTNRCTGFPLKTLNQIFPAPDALDAWRAAWLVQEAGRVTRRWSMPPPFAMRCTDKGPDNSCKSPDGALEKLDPIQIRYVAEAGTAPVGPEGAKEYHLEYYASGIGYWKVEVISREDVLISVQMDRVYEVAF